MAKRFTENAQKIILIAQEEAKRLNHDYVGTEHILLGLCAIEGTVSNQILTSLGVTFRKVRLEIEKMVGIGDTIMLLGEIPFTPRAKKSVGIFGRRISIIKFGIYRYGTYFAGPDSRRRRHGRQNFGQPGP